MKNGCKTEASGVWGALTSAFYLLGICSHHSHQHCFQLCAVLPMHSGDFESWCGDLMIWVNILWFRCLKFKGLHLEIFSYCQTESLCNPVWASELILTAPQLEQEVRKQIKASLLCQSHARDRILWTFLLEVSLFLTPLCMNTRVVPPALKNFCILYIHFLYPQTKYTFMAGRRKQKEMTHPDKSNEIYFHFIFCIC